MPNNQGSKPQPNSTGGIPVQPKQTSTGAVPPQPKQGGTGQMPKQASPNTGQMPRQAASGTGVVPKQPASNTGTVPKQPASNTGTIPKQPASNTGTIPKQPASNTGTIPKQPASNTGQMPQQASPVAGTEPAERDQRQSPKPRRHARHMGTHRPAARPQDAPGLSKPRMSPATKGIALAIVGGLAALGAGFAIGRLTAPPISASAIGNSLVDEEHLDDPVATYAGDLGSGSVSIRDVMEDNASIKAYETNGLYRVPSADLVLSAVRSRIVSEAAKKEGISVTDADLDAQAATMLGDGMGAKDFATAYSVDEETGKKILASTVVMNKLREKVAGERVVADITPPDEPARGSESTPTEAYAKYVLALAGDAWDANKKEWVDPQGAYAMQLSEYDLTKGVLPYEAAVAAYSVASQSESAKQAEVETKWNKYLNDLYDKVTIQISGIGIG